MIFVISGSSMKIGIIFPGKAMDFPNMENWEWCLLGKRLMKQKISLLRLLECLIKKQRIVLRLKLPVDVSNCTANSFNS